MVGQLHPKTTTKYQPTNNKQNNRQTNKRTNKQTIIPRTRCTHATFTAVVFAVATNAIRVRASTTRTCTILAIAAGAIRVSARADRALRVDAVSPRTSTIVAAPRRCALIEVAIAPITGLVGRLLRASGAKRAGEEQRGGNETGKELHGTGVRGGS